MERAPHVLILGYRREIAAALDRLAINYSIWSEKKLINGVPPGASKVLVAPIPDSPNDVAKVLSNWQLHPEPTHIIAGTERGVFPSGMVREYYQTRRFDLRILEYCTDKVAMKSHLSARGIPMTGFVDGNREDRPEIRLGFPLVMKDRRGSGSRNLVIAHSKEQFDAARKRDQIYETYISAKEGSVESFIVDSQIVFANVTEYREKKISHLLPAKYPPNELAAIHDLNQRVINALGIPWGVTHLEFYRTTPNLFFGEIAIRPPGGYIMQLLELAYGFDPWATFVRIELGLSPEIPKGRPEKIAGCTVLHPGAGKINSLKLPEKNTFPCLVKAKIKIVPGDIITARLSVGEDVGYCLFRGDDYKSICDDMDKLKLAKIFAP